MGQIQNQNSDDQRMGRMIGVGVAIGAGLGVALGAAFDNFVLGIAIGMGAGIAIGAAWGQQRPRGNDDQPEK